MPLDCVGVENQSKDGGWGGRRWLASEFSGFVSEKILQLVKVAFFGRGSGKSGKHLLAILLAHNLRITGGLELSLLMQSPL